MSIYDEILTALHAIQEQLELANRTLMVIVREQQRAAPPAALMASQFIPTSFANAVYERDLRAASEASQETEKPDES